MMCHYNNSDEASVVRKHLWVEMDRSGMPSYHMDRESSRPGRRVGVNMTGIPVLMRNFVTLHPSMQIGRIVLN